MIFFESFVLNFLLVLVILHYAISFNLTILLFSAGLFLIFVGFSALCNNLDIFIGFLWLIDCGLGLIFLIFILHFNLFLLQKTFFNITNKQFFVLVTVFLLLTIHFYFLFSSKDGYLNLDLLKIWSFDVTCLTISSLFSVGEFNILSSIKYCYFTFNSFEFYIVNYVLLFALFFSILFFFISKRFYCKLFFSQIKETLMLTKLNSGFFIRSQNFVFQQNTHHSVRVWSR